MGNPSDTSGDMIVFNRINKEKKFKKKKLSLKDYLKNRFKKVNRYGETKRKN